MKGPDHASLGLRSQFVGAVGIPWVTALILSCETYGWRSQLRTLGNAS